MTLSDLQPRIWDENVLFTAMVELTYSCNLDCFFCYNDRGQKGIPLSKEQYFQFFQDLHDMQVMSLVLSGGEPLAHPHFFALGARARELGFVIRIKSNGHALNRRLATRIKKEIDPFVIDISLHGATAETHDRQTRITGSFDQLMKNFQVLKDLGLRFRINGTLTSWNKDETREMFNIAEKLNVSFNLSTNVTPKDDGDQSPMDIAPTNADIENAMRISKHRSAAANSSKSNTATTSTARCGQDGTSTKQCGTGSATITVDPVGNILPCVQWRRPVGNLHNDRISDVWQHSTDLVEIREISQKAKKMVDGYRDKGLPLSYCIGDAVERTGSPLKIYDTVKSQAKIRLKLISD